MHGTANRPTLYMYDGTYWVFMCWSKTDANDTYSNAKLGQGYATCSTAEATVAKTAALSSYALATGGIVAVKFDNAVPASATLNVNSKGAKAMYYKGSAITAGVIKAGDIAYFIYSTYYHLLGIDRAIENDNVIEEVQVDGTALTVTNKTVNITGKQNQATYSTTDIIAGTTPLNSGNLYLVYV